MCKFVGSAVPGFAEVFAFEDVLGSGEGIDQFGFAFIGYVAQHHVSQRFQGHDPPACVRLAIRQKDSLSQVFDNDIFGELMCAKEGRIRRYDLFHDGLIRLRMSGVVGGMNVDMRTDNIIPVNMEMVDDVLFHW